MSLSFNTPISSLGPVGKSIATRLKKLELYTAGDLLWHFPFRYDDYSNLKKINQLVGGEIVTIKVKIELITNKRSSVKRMNITEAMVADDTGSVKIVWFNQPFLSKILSAGDEVYLSGKVDFDYYGMQFVSPEFEKISYGENLNTARLVPVYSSTNNVTQKQFRFLIKQVLKLAKEENHWLPEKVESSLDLLDLPTALEQIHWPEDKKKLYLAQRRLKFEEHFLFQLQTQAIKLEIKQSKANVIKFHEIETKKFVESLPFKLTNDQKKAAWEVLRDMEKSNPMNRLLEGDVGSGKTIVAVMAMLNVFLNSFQSMLIVPTEILASQHFKSISGLLKDFDVNIGLLTRSNSVLFNKKTGVVQVQKNKLIKLIHLGEVDIVIGTHSLIQEKINFKNLALAIIDEQHRFGVGQRHAINSKDGLDNTLPHFLSMSATPIPRSLSLVMAGDLDLSIIKEMPVDRKKVITKFVDASNKKEVYKFIREQVCQGRQSFVVCPLIDKSDVLGVKSVCEEHDELNKKIFPDLEIGMLHGKLKKQEKEYIMKKVSDNEIKILVSTSVIEVGVDIANATVMIIKGADRFGLAQLHQFRGRVGRSTHQSYCFLFSDSLSQKTKERLEALVNCHNGFDLAEKDLELRGPGEIYGTKQSGVQEFKIACLTDFETIKQAKATAENIIKDIDKYPKLKEKLENYNESVHLE